MSPCLHQAGSAVADDFRRQCGVAFQQRSWTEWLGFCRCWHNERTVSNDPIFITIDLLLSNTSNPTQLS